MKLCVTGCAPIHRSKLFKFETVEMDKAIIALNGIVAEGVISDYAIGGAIGAAFYFEAA